MYVDHEEVSQRALIQKALCCNFPCLVVVHLVETFYDRITINYEADHKLLYVQCSCKAF